MPELMFPKPIKDKKPKSRLRAKTPLRSSFNSIPLPVKRAVLEQKGPLCFMGECECCGGQSIIGVHDDLHHFPHRSQGGENTTDHLWPCRRECHQFLHNNPKFEKELFKQIEAAGHLVIWKIQGKTIGGKNSDQSNLRSK